MDFFSFLNVMDLRVKEVSLSGSIVADIGIFLWQRIELNLVEIKTLYDKRMFLVDQMIADITGGDGSLDKDNYRRQIKKKM